MSIPYTKETMGPILDALADGREHADDEIQERVATHFRLTDSERRVLLRNGIPTYKNRTAWGLVYLQDSRHCDDQPQYIEKVGVRNGSEIYRITAAGARAQGVRPFG